jgi:hypothetical protein
LAKRFLEFMKQPATVATMEEYGFVLPTTVAHPGHPK